MVVTAKRRFRAQKGALSEKNRQRERTRSDEGGLARKTKLVQQFRSTVARCVYIVHIQGVSQGFSMEERSSLTSLKDDFFVREMISR